MITRCKECEVVDGLWIIKNDGIKICGSCDGEETCQKLPDHDDYELEQEQKD